MCKSRKEQVKDLNCNVSTVAKSNYNGIMTKKPVHFGGEMFEELKINGKEILRYCETNPKYILIQFIDGNDEGGLEEEINLIKAFTDKPFAFVGIRTKRWNDELSPWKAEPVFGRQGFGGEANKNLDYLRDNVGGIKKTCSLDVGQPVILGGYSLAGLFALWAGYESSIFSGIAAASPSVWFKGWREYIRGKEMKSQAVYLSLGLKESRTSNKRLSEVENCIKMQYNEFSEKNHIKHILEWNEGNHFVDVPLRMARGFSWVLNNI